VPHILPCLRVVATGRNENALGFDLVSDPVGGEALQTPQYSGWLFAASRVKLVHEISHQYGFRSSAQLMGEVSRLLVQKKTTRGGEL
jgi:hypothetical protein